jgi:hypothetical protein
MAVVSADETRILMAMGYAEYIATNGGPLAQSVADRVLAEYRESSGAAAAGIVPGQSGTFEELGITFGEAAGEPGVLDILKEFRLEDIALPKLSDVTGILTLVVIGLVAIAVIRFK